MFIINGAKVEEANFVVPIQNLSFWRGDGIFEAIKIHEGYLFALERHIKRFKQSAKKMLFDDIDFEEIKKDMILLASNYAEGYVRVIISRSTSKSDYDVYIFHQEPVEIPEHYSLQSQPSPWHPGGDFALEDNQVVGTKSTSYALNIAQTRIAEQNGYSDALLLNRENIVLEGPTFSIGWIKGDTVYVPDLQLGILDSITRQYILLFGSNNQIKVKESRIPIDEIYHVDTVFVISTAKHAKFVSKIDSKTYNQSPILDLIQDCFTKQIEIEKLNEFK